MRFIDFLTLILIIAAGLQLGLQGYFHWDMTRALFGGYEKYVFMLMGFSAGWQIVRQLA